jgi:hypothetical protein
MNTTAEHAARMVSLGLRKAVIFDLDGTLALIDHRRHFVEGAKKNWRAFFAACAGDVPNLPVVEVARALNLHFQTVIFSGRSDEVLAETLDWLKRHDVPCDYLVMRRAGDFTPDDELKRGWLGHFDRGQIVCVFDDRAKVVRMWREEGVACFQVAPGEF